LCALQELSSSGGGGNASTWGQAGSPRGGPGNAGVGMGSEGIAENALYRVSLPHIMPLRDWELNLDALQVGPLHMVTPLYTQQPSS
jgi:hypothetical protein